MKEVLSATFLYNQLTKFTYDMNKRIVYVLLLLFIAIPLVKSYAHNPNNSLLYLKVYENSNIEGHFDVNINELNNVLGLSFEKKPDIEKVRLHQELIKAYIIKNTEFKAGGKVYNIIFNDEIEFIPTTFGSFIVFHFELEDSANIPDEVDITYKVFIDENPNHSNLMGMEYNWRAGLINNESIIALDFDKDGYTKTLVLSDKNSSIWKGFMAMINQGIWHIWIGIDHIFFLVALILPSVVRRRKEEDYGNIEPRKFNIFGWEPVKKFKPAFLYILKVVTFFTIAHTITLSLASLNIINLPSRIVETIIAFSIGLAAYHNIRPIFKGKDWLIAFIFGLFHGFGFASVLSELGFKGEYLSLSLLGFNVGVEIGQVIIIAMIFPVLFLIRKLKLYPKLLVYLSVILIIISLYWSIERGFDIDIPIDEQLRRYGYKVAVWLGLK